MSARARSGLEGGPPVKLFAYGTLMDPAIMTNVSGLDCPSVAAELRGYARRTVRGEVYPAIRRGDEIVDGVVYAGVTAAAFARLDRFEGAMYRRVEVSVATGPEERIGAQTYVIAPGQEHLLSDEAWSYPEFLANGRAVFERRYPGYGEVG